ncbi:conserved hypothetical protein [Thiomonas arsenitoxydans]|uniref:Uncharacterized protein n=1 Tax=Thiomonas arsenitoxydans (strain DSM 22701 / CIP 110005 / 3As) TaxID=426114 RepID=D6CVU5_THIA3|nr:hypothetical protein THI_p0038 [Thiomonas arsenitoxydans]CQR32664.1 conserved hypothetical protein [Thiomonas arsenitoxydans]CQR45715.1 conserved protein of unknown function [Thiomonas sp. CB3]
MRWVVRAAGAATTDRAKFTPVKEENAPCRTPVSDGIAPFRHSLTIDMAPSGHPLGNASTMFDTCYRYAAHVWHPLCVSCPQFLPFFLSSSLSPVGSCPMPQASRERAGSSHAIPPSAHQMGTGQANATGLRLPYSQEYGRRYGAVWECFSTLKPVDKSGRKKTRSLAGRWKSPWLVILIGHVERLGELAGSYLVGGF